MQKEIHDWLRTLLPVLIMGVVFYVGQIQSLALIGQKVDTLTGVLQETNLKMERISDKVVSNDKEMGLQNYAIKTLDTRLTKLEDRSVLKEEK